MTKLKVCTPDEINNELIEEFGYGCVPSKKDIRDYKLNRKVCHAVNLPESFEVEHSKIKD